MYSFILFIHAPILFCIGDGSIEQFIAARIDTKDPNWNSSFVFKNTSFHLWPGLTMLNAIFFYIIHSINICIVLASKMLK